MPNPFELLFELLKDVAATIWPLLAGTAVIAVIVYFVIKRQGGVAGDDDQDK
jgi:hypothetical protein